MTPDYRIELRVYDCVTGATVDQEDTYLGDPGSSSRFEMADICLGSLERRFSKTHARHLSEFYADIEEE